MLFFFLSMLETHDEKQRFAELYEAHRNRMARLAWSILRDDFLAEDAVNQAFLKMIHKVKKFQDFSCDQMRDYLVIIVKHTAIDVYNERKKNAEVSFDERFTMDGTIEDEPISMMLEHDEVQEAIDQLDEIYSDVLYLSYRVGLSINEIAKSLDLSPSAVKMRLVRARVKLRAILEGDDVK